MSKTAWPLGLVLTGAIALLALSSHQVARSQDIVKALAINLRTPHPVEGKVSVLGTIQHADTERMDNVVVSTAQREDTPRWTEAGTLETAGFTSLVLSIQGEMKGNVSQAGAIAAILIPDEDPILQALTERIVELPLEVTAEVTPGGTGHFSASRPALPIAFPRYRLFLYNTTDQSASTNVFVYLTN